MKLDVRERFVLMGMLPQAGSFVTLKTIRDLQDNLSFTEEEHKLYKFVESEERVTWDEKPEQSKEIEIGEKATDIIVEALEKLDKSKTLTQDHFSIYEKFVKLPV